MIRALVLTSHYPSAAERTRGTYNESTFVALAKYAAVEVIGPVPWWFRRKKPKAMLFGEHDRVTGIEARFPSYWSIPGATPLHAAAAAAALAPVVRRVAKDFPFDAIVSTWAYPDVVAAAALATRANKPLLATVLGSDVNELPNRAALRPQIRWGLGRAARVVAVSGALGDRVAELGVPRDRIVVLHNGVDGEVFRIRAKEEARRALGIRHARPIVLYVGNVKPEKGVDVLVEAADKLVRVQGKRDVEVVVIGSGELDRAVRARAAELGLADKNVTFAGRKLHSEIPTWLAAADVLCLPSRREGCPNVILEALASGRPVVASHVGGVPELIRGDNGILVRPGDAAALATALAAALDRAWSPEALRATVENLSWDGVARTYLRLLEEIVAA